ncbi:MAG: short-chain fatty acyl-CoA regulator family protein [Pseudomonadota bacterium]|nr:short-chain fatty acyl-CoA regulator family protein [Pseudomonadota bacterium]
MPDSRRVSGPVGLRIRERRKAMRITQVDLARRAGISASYLNLIEADRRAIGGALLQRIADALDLEVDALDGMAERRLVERLGELVFDPALRRLNIEPASATRLVSRHPDWATALLTLARERRDLQQYAVALTDRLERDPVLARAVHQVLNHVASVRSTTEILDTVPDLTEDQRGRFVDIILSESGALSELAQMLVVELEAGTRGPRSLSPADEVDDLFMEARSHFPVLEDEAGRIRRELGLGDRPGTGELAARLEARTGITVVRQSPLEADLRNFRNMCHLDSATGRLAILDNAPPETRRFQITRLLVAREAQEAIADLVAQDVLTTPEARTRATRALVSYLASALLFDYEAFLADAVRYRYDIELLRQRHSGSFEQICQRLVSLRRPGAEGVPFALLRADPSGHVSKRLPIPGMPLPGPGGGCPLWPLFTAFQTPDRLIRQLAEFPGGARFLFVARTVRHDPPNFRSAPFLRTIMLACDIVHADRTVYAEGLDLAATSLATPVGPGCRLCPREGCQQRGEDSALPAARTDAGNVPVAAAFR